MKTMIDEKGGANYADVRFLLGQRCHDSDKNFAFGIHCVNRFLFKQNRYVHVLELPYVFQAVQCVSGKTADGLGNDHINVATLKKLLIEHREAGNLVLFSAHNLDLVANFCDDVVFIDKRRKIFQLENPRDFAQLENAFFQNCV